MSRLLAQLDRRLAHNGEDIFIRRIVGTSVQSFVECRIPAIVRALTVEQMLGGISQQNFIVLISPTHLRAAQWPGGRTVMPGVGTLIAPADPMIPTTSDKVVLRGTQRSVQRVAPVFDGGECIRIELNVLG